MSGVLPGRYLSSHALTFHYYCLPGVVALAGATKDMRAILKFTFSGDFSFSKPVTMETTMTVANFGEKCLGVSGAIMLSAFLPKCT
jgi:hypothetical protein